MPLRPFSREQGWLFPPTLEELLPADHPARFVAAFVDALDIDAWTEMGVDPEGNPLGAPAYHPQVLLNVWLYGFMTGVRSCRKLEAACRDQIPYLWLTGWQFPDHNTLWRFYQERREGMRKLLKRTVRIAVHSNLVDLAVQAVDGSKVVANAARDQTLEEERLAALLERADAAIGELESQNEAGEEAPSPHLPQELTQARALRERIEQALQRSQTEESGHANLTDPDATLMKTRQGTAAAYNAQAMVAGVRPREEEPHRPTGFLITAADVVTATTDSAQLLPMMDQAEETTGQPVPMTLADAGFHSAPNLAACSERNQRVSMPEAHERTLADPYHKERFTYEPETDQYRCPQGQALPFRGLMTNARHPELPSYRVYQARGATCQGCPAFGRCTTNAQGRRLHVHPHAEALRQYRAWMTSDEARQAYARRKELVEPVFGILKEQFGARRFLLRGLAKVRAEWSLLATAFNLRTLWRCWAAGLGLDGGPSWIVRAAA